jgi:hypothetical protein
MATKEAITVNATPWMALFTFILAVLKLTGHIHLSWLWVFLPIWGPVVFFLSIGLVTIIGVFIAAFIVALLNR